MRSENSTLFGETYDKGGPEEEIKRRVSIAKTAIVKLDKIWKDHMISGKKRSYI